MPYNRFTYRELTAQLNVLSKLAENLYHIDQADPDVRKAVTLYSGRLRTEIDRIAANRRKMKAHTPDQFDHTEEQ